MAGKVVTSDCVKGRRNSLLARLLVRCGRGVFGLAMLRSLDWILTCATALLLTVEPWGAFGNQGRAIVLAGGGRIRRRLRLRVKRVDGPVCLVATILGLGEECDWGIGWCLTVESWVRFGIRCAPSVLLVVGGFAGACGWGGNEWTDRLFGDGRCGMGAKTTWGRFLRWLSIFGCVDASGRSSSLSWRITYSPAPAAAG